jgi:DNA polymerase III delta prime subunit
MDNKKKNKLNKNILFFYDKINLLNQQLDFLILNKFIIQDFYIDKMNILNNVKKKVLELEEKYILKVKKDEKDKLEKEMNIELEKICEKIGCNNCKNIINIFFPNYSFIEKKNDNVVDLFNLYNEYFIPLSCNKLTEIDFFKKKHKIEKTDIPIVIPLIDYTKNKTLHEKIDGSTIIFFINQSLILYINGYFKKDSLNIFKKISEFDTKIKQITEDIEYINLPNNFKEKYLEQLNLKDFIILKFNEISKLIKDDYNDFLQYKNKSISLLIKDFIKMSIEKQRKIIILFLLSDEESQFTANILYDLINDQTFLNNSNQYIDSLFNSFHWKIQQLLKISEHNLEESKKKLENISVTDVSYESRILLLKTTDRIKSKALEKLKEINGSKDSSIKAQQWMDGFLKIPFGIYRKEDIIEFFKLYQNKLEKYIEIFTIKISDFNKDLLNDKNKINYNIICQIIDEFHSNVYLKSENCYDNFVSYIEIVKIAIEKELNIKNIENIIKQDENIHDDQILPESVEQLKFNIADLINADSIIDINKDIIDKLIEQNIIPDKNIIDECMNQLNYFKKIKKELQENNILNKNNLNLMIKKLSEIEKLLNLDKINNEIIIDQIEIEDKNYDLNFKNFLIKNINEIHLLVDEWNKYKLKKKIYIQEVDKILNKCTYGQVDAKLQMKRIIGQWINGKSKGQCLGLYGPPGVGKTTLCKNGFAKCLFSDNGESRPFAFLPLGGASNGGILEGYHYTYVGSTWGKIVDILIETKCMNPIIYIDELDKISKTEHGQEIISILTHITDQSQNKEFFDRYFSSIPIDLSEVLFIFSYNDRDNIDRILLDRIQEINVKELSIQEKLIISKEYIYPEILSNIGFSINEIMIDDNILSKIIIEYTREAGVRKLNEILYDIIRDINLKKIEGIIMEYPIVITEEIINNLLFNLSKINIKKINNKSMVGTVNGLYATSSGLGGLTIIQVAKVLSDKKLSLEKLTGNQGDVMKESMNCALTLAWNILPQNIKDQINNNTDLSKNIGLHIHCPESATPKDGPSAGLAITTAIISRIINIPIKNDVAMTGEVDLFGNATEIGGLYSKLQGALSADIKTVLVPFENEKDLDIIFKKEEKNNKEKSYIIDAKKKIFRDKITIILVNNIYEILEHALCENNIEFEKIN